MFCYATHYPWQFCLWHVFDIYEASFVIFWPMIHKLLNNWTITDQLILS
jgi:hypothetical protein